MSSNQSRTQVKLTNEVSLYINYARLVLPTAFKISIATFGESGKSYFMKIAHPERDDITVPLFMGAKSFFMILRDRLKSE